MSPADGMAGAAAGASPPGMQGADQVPPRPIEDGLRVMRNF